MAPEITNASASVQGMTAQEIYQLFKDHLTDRKFKYDPHDEDLVISLTVKGEDLPQLTLIRVLDDREVVQIISLLPFKVPKDKRIEAAIAVSVANYGIINGSFDYDISDGEIRFRVTQSFMESRWDDSTVSYLLTIAFQTTDKYNDKFLMLGKGMLTLEQFIAAEKE